MRSGASGAAQFLLIGLYNIAGKWSLMMWYCCKEQLKPQQQKTFNQIMNYTFPESIILNYSITKFWYLLLM